MCLIVLSGFNHKQITVKKNRKTIRFNISKLIGVRIVKTLTEILAQINPNIKQRWKRCKSVE